MGQHSSQAEPYRQEQQFQQLGTRLKRVDELLASPEQLERESNLQFQRAPLDSHGCMRRIEMRRLLWTFAHHLGSEELTWEAIEVAAVVGTIEPNVPVVTQAEFFRCVYKTVHLVGAELRKRLEKIEPGSRTCHVPGNSPKVEQRQQQHLVRDGVESDEESGDDEEEDDDDDEYEAGPHSTGPIEVPLFSPAPESPRSHPIESTIEAFDPAPGGIGDDMLLVNGMMAMTLSVEGSFDPQRLFINRGHLVIRDPDENSRGRQTLDLRDMVTATTGEAIAHSPFQRLLPGYVKDADALNRMLVLEFEESEVLCLWFSTPEDCSRCLQALKEEAERALESNENSLTRIENPAMKWVTGFFSGKRDRQADESAS